MFRRRPVVVRRAGNPLLRTALVGGAGYMAGQSAAKGAARESSQDARITQLEQEQQGAGTTRQPASAGQVQPSAQQPTEAAAPSTADARIEQLSRLGELHKAGVLTDAEFEAEKQKVLRGE